MIIIYLFIIGIGLFLIIIFLYLLTRFRKFELIKEIKNKKTLWLIVVILFLSFFVSIYFLGLTVIVYLIHLALFFILGDIVFLISKKHIKYNIIGLMVIIITTGYITYAYFNAHNIKETKYVIESEKIDNEINIIQIADVHLGTTIDSDDFNKHINEISLINPDVLVLTGDVVDESTSYEDMIKACNSLGKVKTKYGVYIAFGNHDLNTYGGNRNYTSEQFLNELRKNGVITLEDEIVLINEEFYLIGRRDKTVNNRLKISQLINDIDKDKLIIVLDHQPVDFKNNVKSGVDLVLSGHTHGGQMFPLGYIGELVSDNEMTYGLEKTGKTNFIVSSGMSGWGIPLKTGTISEYVHITIK